MVYQSSKKPKCCMGFNNFHFYYRNISNEFPGMFRPVFFFFLINSWLFLFLYLFMQHFSFSFFGFYCLFCPHLPSAIHICRLPSASAVCHPHPPSAIRIHRPHPYFTESRQKRLIYYINLGPWKIVLCPWKVFEKSLNFVCLNLYEPCSDNNSDYEPPLKELREESNGAWWDFSMYLDL